MAQLLPIHETQTPLALLGMRYVLKPPVLASNKRVADMLVNMLEDNDEQEAAASGVSPMVEVDEAPANQTNSPQTTPARDKPKKRSMQLPLQQNNASDSNRARVHARAASTASCS